MTMEEMGSRAKTAARELARAGTAAKDRALAGIAQGLREDADRILAENQKDLAAAADFPAPMRDRLTLTRSRLESIAAGVEQVAALDDPIGRVDRGTVRPNGLRIEKVRVPLGAIGIIFEARPNVAADAASLCLKSGNACLLRGGREAIRSNLAITAVMRRALAQAGLPADAIQTVEDTSHESTRQMMRLDRYLDVLIPRGGAGLIRTVVEGSTVPVIQTGVGNCHVYVDAAADLDMAARIIFNAKTSRPSVCNAAETLLVHRAVAESFLPKAKALLDTKGVELRGCETTRRILGPQVRPATETDWATEYNDYILAVRVVDSLDEAIAHINRYGTGHSEAIVTEDCRSCRQFMEQVDAAAVYLNASTRFTDGFEFGFGAEIGISTQKLHARGPMGLNELTSVKYCIYGSGQIR